MRRMVLCSAILLLVFVAAERERMAQFTVNSFGRENIWPQAVVPFRFESSYNRSERSYIKSELRFIQRVTCVRFREIAISHYPKPHVLIKDGKECSSQIGRRLERSFQELSLPYSCTQRRGAVLHEILHVLGFNHEQCRSDRDNHIAINFGNIPRKYWFLFGREIDGHYFLKYKLPYDFDSILHYGPFDFAIRKLPTIVSKTKPFRLKSNNELSKMDILKINLLYNCSGYLNNLDDCQDLLIDCNMVTKSQCDDSYVSNVCKKTCRHCL